MRRRAPIFLGVSAALTWAILMWLGESGTDAVLDRKPRTASPSNKTHYVTPTQLVESGAVTDRTVGSLSAVARDGALFRWSGIRGGRPLVLVFIRRNCPCSAQFEPFFHRLAARYGDVVEFAGVIDADAGFAEDYATANKTPYRVLADPDRAIIDRFEAKNGGYVALLRPEGVVDTLWPGYSAEMMSELGRRIAALAAVTERSIDVAGMPGAMTTGCPYESPSFAPSPGSLLRK